MKLPSWDELIGEQLEVLEHPLHLPLFVAGPPGSGKTVLAVRRAEMITETEATVVLVTFNRMLRRLATLLTDSTAAMRTMHSFAFCDYRDRTGSSPPAFDGYDYCWQEMLTSLTDHPNSMPVWRHAVIDEGQDLPPGFFTYLYRHGAHVLTVFADEDQALSPNRTTLLQIQEAAGLPDPFLLTENHRNSPEIAALAERFHSGVLPASMVRRPPIGQRPRLLKRDVPETIDLISTWVENRGGSVGVIVSSNALAVKIHEALSIRLSGHRVDCYTSQWQNEDTISLLDEGITVMNRASVKGQEFDAVFILELEQFIPCQNDLMKRSMYMMCSRARDYLFLMHTQELSGAALADLPGAKVLERG